MADPTGATPQSRVYATVYSPSFLSMFYDFYVLRFNMRYMWGCPTDSVLLPFFSENFSRRHLDCGVATGFFPAVALSRPFRAQSTQHLTLLDINANSLVAAHNRVLAHSTGTEIKCVKADVTAPLPKALKGERFETISMFNLFHCVPGPNKLDAIGIFKELLTDDGVLTGCTVLGRKHATGWLSRLYVRYFNHAGFFNNLDDNEEDIRAVLEQEFKEVETWVIGMMMLFRARKPRRTVDELL
ncbi:methyltransferase [Pseudomassariella vexata]|uniref:Methyltransferase n=1 Tax=Pseudomassariella vexata TaxID=1141098 RepID=A0A1Y2EH38_9PEZI|nr:methyltransferase [Pseudomassariella vexata]ORY70105.1 methyltransferase [Pseudomassariella vexata]